VIDDTESRAMTSSKTASGHAQCDPTVVAGVAHPRKRLSLKTRLAVLRARFSLVGLLARQDERKVVSVVAAANGGLAILAIGCFSLITNSSLMFPALGPTAFILFSTPTTESATPRSVILGHFSGMACGWAAWHLSSTLVGGSVSLQIGGFAPILSASLALAATCAILIRLSCPHAPACASSMIIALGGVTDWLGVLLMAVAVVWITAQAVAINRFAGLPVVTWSHATKTDLVGAQ